MTTPEDGHTWHFVVTSRESSNVVGQPKRDAEHWSAPWTLEVRAWSLSEACEKAARTPLNDWGMPVEAEGLDDGFPDHGEAEDAKAARGEPTPVTATRDDDYSPEAINRTADEE